MLQHRPHTPRLHLRSVYLILIYDDRFSELWSSSQTLDRRTEDENEIFDDKSEDKEYMRDL